MGKIEHESDYNLAHRYLCGNTDAGRELFAKIHQPIQKFISSRTNGYSEEDRADILNETMCRCIDKLGTYNGSSSFLTFATGVAKNTILEDRRKKCKDSKTLSLDELRDTAEEPEELSYFMNPELYVLKKEMQQQVQTVLDSLSPEHRDIIMFKILNGMPYKTIATITGESVEALESRFRRAIREFVKRMRNL